MHSSATSLFLGLLCSNDRKINIFQCYISNQFSFAAHTLNEPVGAGAKIERSSWCPTIIVQSGKLILSHLIHPGFLVNTLNSVLNSTMSTLVHKSHLQMNINLKCKCQKDNQGHNFSLQSICNPRGSQAVKSNTMCE